VSSLTTRPSAKGTAERQAAAARFGVAFKGAMGAVRRLRGRDTHRPGELSYAQFGLLFGLFEAGGDLSASDLAGCADVSPGTATQMLDGLEAHGLIERRRSDRDRRSVLVSLTERGSEVVAARKTRYQAHWDETLAEFSSADLDVAAAVLDRIRAMFGELALEAERTEP
jgi:MarR family transcriptional regulator, organic hydroperoxide resistance regulator